MTNAIVAVGIVLITAEAFAAEERGKIDGG